MARWTRYKLAGAVLGATLVVSTHADEARVRAEADRYVVQVTPSSESRAQESRARAAAVAALINFVRFSGRPASEARGVTLALEMFATRTYGSVQAHIERMECVERPGAPGREYVFVVPRAAVAGIRPLAWEELKKAFVQQRERAARLTALEAWVGIELDEREAAQVARAWLMKCAWPLGDDQHARRGAEPLLMTIQADTLWQQRAKRGGVEQQLQTIAEVLRVDARHAGARAALSAVLQRMGLVRAAAVAERLYCEPAQTLPDYVHLLRAWLPPAEDALLAATGVLDAQQHVPSAWHTLWKQYEHEHPAAAVCVWSAGMTNLTRIVDAQRATQWFASGLQAYTRENYNLQEALRAFLYALDFEPTNAAAYMYAGACLSYAREPVNALPFLFAAVRLAPQAAEAHTHLALCYYQLNTNDTRAAAGRWRHAQHMEPSNQWVRSKAALFHLP